MKNQLKPGVFHDARDANDQVLKDGPAVFSEVALKQMQDHFAAIDHITDEHWSRIREVLENVKDSRIGLYQISAANIKFLSKIVDYYMRTGVIRRP